MQICSKVWQNLVIWSNENSEWCCGTSEKCRSGEIELFDRMDIAEDGVEPIRSLYTVK